MSPYVINVNPELAYVNPVWAGFGPDVESTTAGAGGGTNWDRVVDRTQDGLGVINGVLCTINPNRPGCNPNAPAAGGNNGGVVQDNVVPTWVWIMIGLFMLTLLVVLIKK